MIMDKRVSEEEREERRRAREREERGTDLLEQKSGSFVIWAS